MLRERYKLDKLFMEIAQHVPEMDPVLAQIDVLLDDEELFGRIKADLGRRYPRTTQTGRSSTPVEVIVRMLAIKHLYHLSYEQTERQVRDSLVLRQFCRVYLAAVPDDTTLLRWANQIRPETLAQFNQRLLHLATQRKLTRGRKLRTDGTVVETAIAYPSDSKLLSDGVRVLSRTLKRLKTYVSDTIAQAKPLFRDRTRSARQVARTIQSAARRRSDAAKTQLQQSYQHLVQISQAGVAQAKQVLTHLHHQPHPLPETMQWVQTLQTSVPRIEQVIEQTRRRVFEDESVPAHEKLVSLFEPHTAIIRRNKAGKETEFGHKVWLDEVEGGLVSHWRVLGGNPADETQWQPALDAHRQLFGRPPRQASGDRGLYSPHNEAYAQAQGVKRIILPKRGHKSEKRRQYEHQGWFRRGRRIHAGIEGRISVLKRKHGLGRCCNHGEAGLQRWVGWGVIAGNLAVMGRHLATTTP